MHSSRVFQIKLIGRLIYELQKKSGSHMISYQSLLLSTIVLNDSYILTVICECSYVLSNEVIWLAKYLVCILHVRMQIHMFFLAIWVCNV